MTYADNLRSIAKHADVDPTNPAIIAAQRIIRNAGDVFAAYGEAVLQLEKMWDDGKFNDAMCHTKVVDHLAQAMRDEKQKQQSERYYNQYQQNRKRAPL